MPIPPPIAFTPPPIAETVASTAKAIHRQVQRIPDGSPAAAKWVKAGMIGATALLAMCFLYVVISVLPMSIQEGRLSDLPGFIVLVMACPTVFYVMAMIVLGVVLYAVQTK
jgi:hypothetical protein